MNKSRKKSLTFCTLIVLVLCTALFCSFGPDAKELETVVERRFYSFTPETILDSLAQGETDVFTPIVAAPDLVNPASETTVHWDQNDFLLVAQAIHEQTWGEPLGAQNLFYLLFEMNCLDIEHGTFREAFIQSYKLIQTRDYKKRIERWITISLRNELIDIEELEYKPDLHEMKPIDLTQYQIIADEGLQIAEKNGGSEVRTKADNDCEISVFSPTVNGEGWEVTYVNYPEKFVNTLFRIVIDSQTGQSNILNSTHK